MLNKYYQKHKEKLEIEASERYQNLSVEEINEIWSKIYTKIFLKKKKKKTSVSS